VSATITRPPARLQSAEANTAAAHTSSLTRLASSTTRSFTFSPSPLIALGDAARLRIVLPLAKSIRVLLSSVVLPRASSEPTISARIPSIRSFALDSELDTINARTPGSRKHVWIAFASISFDFPARRLAQMKVMNFFDAAALRCGFHGFSPRTCSAK
jgi:hypothetical protein